MQQMFIWPSSVGKGRIYVIIGKILSSLVSIYIINNQWKCDVDYDDKSSNIFFNSSSINAIFYILNILSEPKNLVI